MVICIMKKSSNFNWNTFRNLHIAWFYQTVWRSNNAIRTGITIKWIQRWTQHELQFSGVNWIYASYDAKLYYDIGFGNKLYGHFCTASIYVFSRCPNRMKWYGKELLQLINLICIFELVFLSTTAIASVLRYQVILA